MTWLRVKPAGQRHEAGFTLIELLVSLVLAALLMAAIPPSLRFAKRALATATALDRRFEAEAALSFIEQRLAEATSIYDRGDDGRLRIIFSGDANRITFVAPAAFEARTSGLATFDIRLAPQLGETAGGLAMSWTSWRPALVAGERGAAAPLATRLMLPGAVDFQISYFGQPSASEKAVWADQWRRIDTVPDLVELKVSVNGEAKVRRVALRLKLP